MYIIKCFKPISRRSTKLFQSITRDLSSCLSSDLVRTEKRSKVLMIGINRPQVKNCVNRETAQQLLKAFNEFETSDDCLVAILHGFGGNFCSGFDLKELSTMNEENIDINELSIVGPMGPTRMLTTKPTIAAISGYAVAGGLELSLMCDLRVVEENAVLGVFCRRFGVPLIDGGTVRLPKLIGLSRALDMILTGRAVDAKEALDIGLANRITAVGTGLGTAFSLATSLTRFPQQCLRADRMSAYYSTFSAKSLDDGLLYESENGKQVINKESINGAKSFANQGIGKHGKFDMNRNEDLYNVEVTV